MTNHQKRLSVPKSWPVERKTETFTTKAGAGPHGEDGVPLNVVLRDVLGYVNTNKECRYALEQGTILVNGDSVADERRPIGMFDILAFTEREEYYRVFPDEGGRLALTPIAPAAAESRLGKVVRKTTVPGGDVQLTLHDGTTLRVDPDSEYSPKDSIVIDNETKDVVAHFPYEEGALVTAVDGQHAGEIGVVDSIDVTLGSGDNTVTVEQDDAGFETVEPYVVVIDENFIGDDETSPIQQEEDDPPDAETEESDADAETEESDADAEVTDEDEDVETVEETDDAPEVDEEGDA